jgi:outer membrane protein assembly factor BamB
MDTTQSSLRPLRVWPGVVAVALQWFLWLALPRLVPDTAALGMIGGIVGGGLAVMVWWAFFSRVPKVERWGALTLMIVVAFATRPFLDVSIQGGMMRMMFGFMVVPTFCLALVLWAVVAKGLPQAARRVALLGAILAGSAVWAAVRTDGVMGEGQSQLAWRWTPSPEQKLLAADPVVLAAAAPIVETTTVVEKAPLVETPVARMAGSWPGFRGPNRDDRVTGVRIRTDWGQSPPKEMWRRAVGPAWSSFAVGEGLIYTQEQRGEFEVRRPDLDGNYFEPICS